MQRYFESKGINIERVHGLFHLHDSHGQGLVNLQEFVMACMRLGHEPKPVDEMTLMYENKRVISILGRMIWDLREEVAAHSQTNAARVLHQASSSKRGRAIMERALHGSAASA